MKLWVDLHSPQADGISFATEYCFDYQQAKNDWESFIENLTKKIIEKDKTIPEQTTRDIVSGT